MPRSIACDDRDYLEDHLEGRGCAEQPKYRPILRKAFWLNAQFFFQTLIRQEFAMLPHPINE